MAALGATAVAWRVTPRWAAMAAIPVLPERAALAATLLADLAALAVTAALAGRLMAATRLVAMAATELCSLLVTTSREWTYGIAGKRRAGTGDGESVVEGMRVARGGAGGARTETV